MRTMLADGTEVAIRPIRPSDKEALSAGLRRLSPETVAKRFLAVKLAFTAAELRYLTEVDGLDHYAVVAIDPRRLDEVVAVARFVRNRGDRTTAEAAIVVCDAYQGRRLGTRLAELLADAARRRGIRRIEASMSSDNRPALALMRTIAYRLQDGGHRGGVHELVAELAA